MKYKAKKKKKKKDILSLRWEIFFYWEDGTGRDWVFERPRYQYSKKSNEWVGKLQIIKK